MLWRCAVLLVESQLDLFERTATRGEFQVNCAHVSVPSERHALARPMSQYSANIRAISSGARLTVRARARSRRAF
jgi:hypothetical protein